MAGDDFPTRLAAFTGDDDSDSDGLPSPGAVLAGVLSSLRGADRSSASERFDPIETSHENHRYAFACLVEFAGSECTARLVVRREDGYVYARFTVQPPDTGGLLDRVRRRTGYDALGVDASLVDRLAAVRRRVVARGMDTRVTTARTTEDPVGFELRFETAETGPSLSATDYDDGRDYLETPLPDLALRAVDAERKVLD
ncbi:hypothetical protein [Halobacterium zhouii]|uniref:hypothetical protein n=1 Tax=Halobacterium zhouii TaxID=2902624 RepID=UPI001E2BF918|nr:hypothetical protein [Halobacterium zhouii]